MTESDQANGIKDFWDFADSSCRRHQPRSGVNGRSRKSRIRPLMSLILGRRLDYWLCGAPVALLEELVSLVKAAHRVGRAARIGMV